MPLQFRYVVLIAVSAFLLVGCSAQTPPEDLFEVSSGNATAKIPRNWTKLTNEWVTDNTILAYGDVRGHGNRQSLIVTKQAQLFNSSTEKLDQAYCEEYARLANVGGIYELENPEVKIDSVNFTSVNNNHYCEINYSWQPAGVTRVQGIDLVKISGNDVYVIEGTNVDGNDFNSVKQAVFSVTI